MPLRTLADDPVEFLAGQDRDGGRDRRPPAVWSDDRDVRADVCRLQHLLQHAELVQSLVRVVDQPIAAHFVARKRLAVSQHHIQPCPGQCQRAGRTRRARPDHQHVTLLRNRIVLTAHQARRDDA